MKTYLVGGAVRDTYMGKTPSDRDYVVVGSSIGEMLAANYEQVGAVFPVFLHPVTGDEYALARVERKVGAGYHGFETVTEDVTLVEDLSRRDFTINAMAIDMETADLIDPFGGLKDIKAQTLRHVGPAFREDPLRVVRMARFLGRFPGFTVADETFELAREMVANGELNELSWERFGAEVRKVLDTCTPDGCFTFFDVLDKLKFHQHVAFFAGIDLMAAARAARLIKLKLVGEARPIAMAALGFRETEVREHVGGRLGATVGLLMDRLELAPATLEVMHETLKKSGAWNNSPSWTMLLACVQLGESLGMKLPFSWAFMLHAEAVTTPQANRGAELAASGVSGADIGRAIHNARVKALVELDLQPTHTG